LYFLAREINFAAMIAKKSAGKTVPSRLQAELARQILQALSEDGARPGQRLVELDLCARFGVSRTPVRGALKLLATDGILTVRQGRGYVLASSPPEPRTGGSAADDDRALFAAMTRARLEGRLADSFTRQELMRRFAMRPGPALRLLGQLAEVGLVEKRPGNGWAFVADTARAIDESYAFRRALEPQLLLQPGFRLDRAWARKARAAHNSLRAQPWRPGASRDFHILNADFHHNLARCCGNRIMHKAVERQNRLRRFLGDHWDYPKGQVHRAIDDHLEILDALEAGYADKAAALMLHHLTTSGPPHRQGDE
jgi:DNA-binding GntR family transcriptional regulator